MTTDDRSRYLDAFKSLQKRLERKGVKISHVIWRGGHIEGQVTATDAEPPAPVETRSSRGVEVALQGALL